MARFLFFTEAGERAGLGHLTRCSALASALQTKGTASEVTFVLDAPEGSATDLVPAGCTVEYRCWYDESDDYLKKIAKCSYTIIDSYRAPASTYEAFSRAADGRLVMIDDDLRLNYPRGIILNPAVGAEHLPYHPEDGVALLAGAPYVLLRKPFWNVPSRNVAKEIRTVLVSFGGGGISPAWRKDLDEEIRRELAVQITCLSPSYGVTLNAEKVREKMLSADLCVSAGGQTLYELAACGIPTVGISVAGNQYYNLLHLEQAGFLAFAGKSTDQDIIEKVMVSLGLLIAQSERDKRSRTGQKIIDGKGALRTAEKLLKQEVFPCPN